MNSLFYFLSFFFLCKGTRFNVNIEGETDLCDFLKTENSGNMTNIMYLCSNDPKCSHYYYQEPGRENMTLFKYLAGAALKKYNYETKNIMNNLFCKGLSWEKLESIIVTMSLISDQLENRPICSLNQKLEIDKKTLKMSCVCQEDANCEVVTDDFLIITIISYTAVGLFAIIIFFYMADLIINNNKQSSP